MRNGSTGGGLGPKNVAVGLAEVDRPDHGSACRKSFIFLISIFPFFSLFGPVLSSLFS